ncbi:TPA: transporter [Escherichia coli]
MDDKVWRLKVFLVDGREMTVALYKDEGEALTDALSLAEDERVLGYRIKPVKWEVVTKKCKNTA